MHILFIPSWYNTKKNFIAGSFIEDQARMIKKKHFVGVIFPNHISSSWEFIKNMNIYSEKRIENNLPVYTSNTGSVIPTNLGYFPNMILLKYNGLKLYRQYTDKYGVPDIIHVHSAFFGGELAEYLSNKFHIPYVITEHNSSLVISDEFSKYPYCDSLKKIYMHSKKVIFVGLAFKNDFLKKHPWDIETSVIPNVINPIFFGPVKNFPMNRSINIINIGGLVPVKNQVTLIKSVGILKNKFGLDFNLKIIGQGHEKKNILTAIDDMGMNDRIEMIPICSREEVKAYLEWSHVLISTSLYETFGVNIAEATAVGRPVIVFNAGGPSMIVNESNGIIVTENDPVLFASALYEVYSNYARYDPEQIRKECYSKFSEEVIYNKIVTEYNAIINRKISPARERPYKICTKCILDTNDYPDILFDNEGICNVCRTYDEIASRTIVTGEEGKKLLNKTLNFIKNYGKNKQYDSILGISGGTDSTYLAYLAKQWGLRPLIVHIDYGWNTELAVKNIEETLKKLKIDLYTHVIDWEEMKDIQKAFLKASVIDIDLPADNAIEGGLYYVARKFGLKIILTGHNISTEGWIPIDFVHNKYDTINMKAIHKKFGTVKTNTFPFFSIIELYLSKKVFGFKRFSPLNYIDYNKDEAKIILGKELEWRYYGSKHNENIFTRFYQGYILPVKFKLDKRKFHLSTLICSGQILREDALNEIHNPPYKNDELLKEDMEFFIRKLNLTQLEFNQLMALPVYKHTDYRSYMNIYYFLRPFARMFIRE